MPRYERCRVEGCDFPIYLTDEKLCLDHVLHPARIPADSVPPEVFHTLTDIAFLNGVGPDDPDEQPDAVPTPEASTPSRSAKRTRSTPKE